MTRAREEQCSNTTYIMGLTMIISSLVYKGNVDLILCLETCLDFRDPSLKVDGEVGVEFGKRWEVYK